MPIHGPPTAIYLSAHYSLHRASLVRRPAAAPFWWRAYDVWTLHQLVNLSHLLSLPVSRPCFSQVAQCVAPCCRATLKSKNKSDTVCYLSILVSPNNPLLCFKVDHQPLLHLHCMSHTCLVPLVLVLHPPPSWAPMLCEPTSILTSPLISGSSMFGPLSPCHPEIQE